MHHLIARHLEGRRVFGLATCLAVLEFLMQWRDTAAWWKPTTSLVDADGAVDNVEVKARFEEHIEKPRALGAKQPISKQVQAITGRNLSRREGVRDVSVTAGWSGCGKSVRMCVCVVCEESVCVCARERASEREGEREREVRNY